MNEWMKTGHGFGEEISLGCRLVGWFLVLGTRSSHVARMGWDRIGWAF